MKHASTLPTDEKETGRVEAFSDGLFAIAMTLLVLDLKVPAPADLAHRGDLVRTLRADWPHIFNFVTSFLTILVMWVNHHRIFTHVRRIDPVLLTCNGLLLLGISAVPFSTAVASVALNTPDAHAGAALYSAAFTLIAVFFNILWRYAVAGDRLIGPHPDRKAVNAISERYRFGPMWYVGTFGLAWISPVASLICCLALAGFFMLPYSHEQTPTAMDDRLGRAED